MANNISIYFTDEELESQLRMQFPYDEMYDMDFKTIFSHIEDVGDYLKLRLRGRVFNIDKITGVVSEVKVL